MLSPADAIERPTCPARGCSAASKTSASSQHWAYRIVEKSACSAASARVACSLGVRELVNDARAAIQSNTIAVAQPGGHARDGDDGRNAELASDDCRMRQHAAVLGDHAGGHREQHDPPRIGPLGDEDFTRTHDRPPGIQRHSNGSFNDAGAAPDPLALVACGRLGRVGGANTAIQRDDAPV